ncbi:twin-arginine translocation protein, TatA/E family subunit [Solidesulfovibrio fructosivorans JJ]]|uniref:Sec-independent protein translocase protein TatA n=1 Tax=Solidesulfovibrio fructosivorans JJ] TaxID=596151 RepID=E1JZP5_SOLFR|nr:twin-arginine translocase TatA/TatE family subunit [Solidesulfovibrio fructosivorans]EFL50180.1 twin-arginine translocation protein, TatA/E family subunit [Solidesulfovibrio fructosivorans JJ]]
MFAGLFEPIHLLLILGVVLIIFGPGKLANVGHDLGKAVRDFRAATEARDVTPEVAAAAKPVEEGNARGETL